MSFNEEVDRIRHAYARRDATGKKALYAWHQPDTLLSQFRLRATIARALVEACIFDLGGSNVLDVGCGFGSWLRLLLEWGADAERLHGVDLLSDRIEKARTLSPHIDFKHANGWPLPFETGTMDLVSAHTVFSSILMPQARAGLADEMKRVMHPDGAILIYDFRVSDIRNPDTIGIGSGEIRRIFPGMRMSLYPVTLAPPLQRPLARLSPVLAHLIEGCFPMLRTHAVYFLRRRSV